MRRLIIKFQTLDPKAEGQLKAPSRAYDSPAGTDLVTIEALTIPPGTRVKARTGLAMEIQQGYYGRIADKSGLALKHGVTVLGGVVDPDYRGEICVILMNLGSETLTFPTGSKIAQIIFEPFATPEFVQVEGLRPTLRDSKGFGSSSTST